MSNRFAQVYCNSRLRAEFAKFLANVLYVHPANELHTLIDVSIGSIGQTDESVYRKLAGEIPNLQSKFANITRSLAALKRQRAVMVEQTLRLLRSRPTKKVSTYLEIGTAGRYVRTLQKQLGFSSAYLVTEPKPGFGLTDMFERGGITRPWRFGDLSGYCPIHIIPARSVELATIYIGVHHAPLGQLKAFISSLAEIVTRDGHLIVREHDCQSEEIRLLAALAHDVYNVATGVSWEENVSELRHFRSIEEFDKMFASFGFYRGGDGQLQDGDPTMNMLRLYERA